MKRTYTKVVRHTQKIEEELPPGRYLMPGEIIVAGDLYLSWDAAAKPSIHVGGVVCIFDTNTYYRPDPPKKWEFQEGTDSSWPVIEHLPSCRRLIIEQPTPIDIELAKEIVEILNKKDSTEQ